MKVALIAADIVAALFLAIVFVGYDSGTREIPDRSRHYHSCLLSCLAGLTVDALSYLIDGRAELSLLVGLVDYLSFLMMDVVIVFITIDLCARILAVKKDFNPNYRTSILLVCAFDVVLLTIGTLTGKLFTVENGVYTVGAWNDFCTFLPSVCFLANLTIVVKNAGVLGKEQARVMMIYFIMPGIAAILLIIDGDLAFSYVGLALGMALFFVLVQSKLIAETNLRSQMLDELSSTDMLTGLKNRRSYELILSELSGEDVIGAVFCDLNSLKEVNDSFGHEAGDRLIQRFAGILQEAFPEDHVFRISGDVFVVIVRNVDVGQFPAKMQRFSDTLRDNDRIAAFGFEVGEGKQAVQVIKAAEQRMYCNKDEYYLETGKQRRHVRPAAQAQSD